MPVSLHAVPCQPPCRTYQGSLTTFACKRKIIELRGEAQHATMQDRSLSFPDFRRKRRQATPNLFTTLGVCVAAGLTTLRELRHERYYLSGWTRRRDWCGALVPGPALIVFGRWCVALAKPLTPHRVTTHTTIGNVTAASSVPSATAPDTGFTSRWY